VNADCRAREDVVVEPVLLRIVDEQRLAPSPPSMLLSLPGAVESLMSMATLPRMVDCVM